MRVVSTRVFPEPAPASTSTGLRRAARPRAARGSVRASSRSPDVTSTDVMHGQDNLERRPAVRRHEQQACRRDSPRRCAARARGRFPSRAPSWRSPARRCGARSSRGTPGPSSATRMRTPPSGSARRRRRRSCRRDRRARRSRSSTSASSAHSSSTASPLHDERLVAASTLRSSTRVRERRHARAEVVGDALDELADVDLLASRRPPDALEAMGHTLEPLEVAAPCASTRACASARSPSRSLEQLDPAAEAGERRAELVRRLARHAGPDLLALGAAARAQRVDAREQQQREQRRPAAAG